MLFCVIYNNPTQNCSSLTSIFWVFCSKITASFLMKQTTVLTIPKQNSKAIYITVYKIFLEFNSFVVNVEGLMSAQQLKMTKKCSQPL